MHSSGCAGRALALPANPEQPATETPEELFAKTVQNHMNNWYLKFVAFGFLALGVGMLAAWLASFFFWKPNILKGIGFVAAGLAVMIGDFAIRYKLDSDGIYDEVRLLLFLIPIRIPAWLFGLAIMLGGVGLICTAD